MAGPWWRMGCFERYGDRDRAVAELVDSGWVRLFALDPKGSAHRRLVPGEGWEPA